MKKLLVLLPVLLLCLFASACGGSQSPRESRAERSKPRVAIGGDTVMLRRPPAPNVSIAVDGTLRIDDIQLPLAAAQKQKLQQAFMQWQMLRQPLVLDGQLTAEKRSLPVTPPPALQALQQELMQDIPELRAYKESFGNLRAEWH